MLNTIFDKTDKGREEIATRCHHLQSRMRTLLLLVDGKQAASALLQKVGSMGLDESSIAELLTNGFIRIASAVAPVKEAESFPPAPAATTAPALTTAPEPAPTSLEATLPEGKTQFEALYQFYTSTIKSTIGLRGYSLQLKVEKAANIDDFRQLRRPYLEAVLKARGEEMARSLRDRLDQLLGADGGGATDMGSTLFAAHVTE